MELNMYSDDNGSAWIDGSIWIDDFWPSINSLYRCNRTQSSCIFTHSLTEVNTLILSLLTLKDL